MSSTSHNTHSVDDLIRAQLGPLQATIFTSFQGGDEALSSFKESWSSFKKTYDACSSILLEETRTTVESFAYLLHTISSALLASELIHEQYERDIAHLADVKFKKLSLNDQSDPSVFLFYSSSTFDNTDRNIAVSTPQAPYIKSCYVWLLNNLHNPYPSKALRARIADETNYDARDIDAWFVDARRRIGWNRVRRAHFETRADMVKAATRHFKPKARAIRSGPYNPPFQPDDVSTMDYSSHFVAMEADAQALYSHKFIPATLATSIDPTKRPCAGKQDTTSSYPSPRRTPSRDVERTSGVDDNSDKPQKRRNSEIDFDLASADGALRPLRPLKRSRCVIDFKEISFYLPQIRIASPSFVHSNPSSSLPSPSPSFHRGVSFSPSPSVATSPLEEDVNSAFVTGKRKRRTSDANEYDSESSDIIRVRRKRRGGDIDVESDISTSNSLSQQKRSLMSVSSSLQPLLHTTPSPVSNQSLEQSTSRKRKRRLSNAEGDQAPKHPTHAALMVPRLQTVSNPLPIYSFSSSVQDVPTNLLTEVSCLAETATFDLSKNVEIEVFDYASQPILSDYLSQVNPASSYPGWFICGPYSFFPLTLFR